MKKNNYIFRWLFLSLVIFGLGVSGTTALAEKKATEGNNEADVEFYKPTPKKDNPTNPKGQNVISKVLPQTGEKYSTSFSFLGISILGGVILCQLRLKKVGVDNDK